MDDDVLVYPQPLWRWLSSSVSTATVEMAQFQCIHSHCGGGVQGEIITWLRHVVYWFDIINNVCE